MVSNNIKEIVQRTLNKFLLDNGLCIHAETAYGISIWRAVCVKGIQMISSQERKGEVYEAGTVTLAERCDYYRCYEGIPNGVWAWGDDEEEDIEVHLGLCYTEGKLTDFYIFDELFPSKEGDGWE